MGRAKADLPFGPETLLQRVVRLLRMELEPVVIVHAEDQVVPRFDEGVTLVADPSPFEGPLLGLLTGLETLHEQYPQCQVAFVTSCDTPFLSLGLVRFLFEQLGPADVAVPVDGKFHFPLAAVYRTRLRDTIRALWERGERRPRALFEVCHTKRMATERLAEVDPGLQTFTNLNTPEEYRAALVQCGMELPEWLQR